MSDVSSPRPELHSDHPDGERVRALCRRHWLGLDESAEHRAAADRVRHGYYVTATEHYRAATRIYEILTAPEKQASPHPPAFTYVHRNVQLLLAYSALWEAFRYVYDAASYTHFALAGAEREPVEGTRAKMDRVLRAPILPEPEVLAIGLLRNGETPAGAIQRLCSRQSRELEQIAGEAHPQTLTDMDAFMQGRIAASPATQTNEAPATDHAWESWVVRALDDAGLPIVPDSPLSAEKYRSAIQWFCYQIRRNINFVGSSGDSLDDVILVIRAFCLLDPIVNLLLQESRKNAIFAL
jgi:hypothetical protein